MCDGITPSMCDAITRRFNIQFEKKLAKYRLDCKKKQIMLTTDVIIAS